jgi:hypothetical protein
MSYYVLTQNGGVISRTTVMAVTTLEAETDKFRARFAKYNAAIKDKFGNDNFPVNGGKRNPADWADFYKYNKDFSEEFSKVYGDKKIKDAKAVTPDIADDTYL